MYKLCNSCNKKGALTASVCFYHLVREMPTHAPLRLVMLPYITQSDTGKLKTRYLGLNIFWCTLYLYLDIPLN